MIYILLVILIIIITFIIYNFLRLKDLQETTDICEQKLFEVLDIKHEKIIELVKILNNKDFDKTLKDINTDDLFKFEEDLYNIHFNINKDFNSNKKIKPILKSLDKTDEEIDGLKDFYNMNANKYNYLYEKKILMYIFKIFKYEKKEIFKIRKIAEFNILKD